MITVKSPDIEKVRRLHKKYPKLIFKTFPATAREETKTWRRDIKLGTKAKKWATNLRFGSSKPIDTTRTPRTRIIKNHRAIGISITPAAMGPAVLMEMGSKGRKKKSGANTGIFSPKPVYSPEWFKFKRQGKRNIQGSFLKATMRIMDREIRKAGLK